VNDTGDAHSPILGWAYDSYPVFGPYQANNTLAVSCWQARNFSALSVTGCNDSTRSCTLVDQFDYTQGVTYVAKSYVGPNTTTTITSQSRNPISSESGIYYEDYFYNSTCGNLGAEYLNEYNGHSHDGYGFHYHTTLDSSLSPAFPYHVGPKFYGCIKSPDTCFAAATGTSSSTSVCGTTSAVSLSTQQCLTDSFSIVATLSPAAVTSISPSAAPSTRSPTTLRPSPDRPTFSPYPTIRPTVSPSASPSRTPTDSPNTDNPSATPSKVPTVNPTTSPSFSPTTSTPTALPTSAAPSFSPTTSFPSFVPSFVPTQPTAVPTFGPTAVPSVPPSANPTKEPTFAPTFFFCVADEIVHMKPNRSGDSAGADSSGIAMQNRGYTPVVQGDSQGYV
jgi:hypothetical protein